MKSGNTSIKQGTNMKPKSKPLFHRKNIHIGDHIIRLLIFRTHKLMVRYLNNKYGDKHEQYQGLFFNYERFIGGIRSRFIGQIIIHLNGEKEFTLTHECVHAAMYYLELTGTPLNFGRKSDAGERADKYDNAEERLCDVTGYLVYEALEFIKTIRR
jgi:hypothetical protein